MYNLYGYVEDSKKEQVAERGRSSGCFRRLPCGQNIDQCRASDKGEGSERQFAPRIARPGKRRQRGEIKGIARDPAPDRRRRDRKSAGQGTRVSVRVGRGGGRHTKKKKN